MFGGFGVTELLICLVIFGMPFALFVYWLNRQRSENLMSEPRTTVELSDTGSRGFFGKLANGDYGLAMTFWLYGYLVGFLVVFVANMVLFFIESVGVYIIIILALLTYQVFVFLGIWRAANKYEGSQVWAVLAKIATVLGAFYWVNNMYQIVVFLTR